MGEGAESSWMRLFGNQQLCLGRTSTGLVWISCWVCGNPQPHRVEQCWAVGRMAVSSHVPQDTGHTMGTCAAPSLAARSCHSGSLNP